MNSFTPRRERRSHVWWVVAQSWVTSPWAVTRSWVVACCCIALVFALNPSDIGAQVSPAQSSSGVIEGRVVDEAGAPAANVAVRIEGTSLVQLTDANGAFRFSSVSARSVTLVIEQIGWTGRREVTVPSGDVVRVELTIVPSVFALDQVVVTTSREAQRRAETPATVNTVSGADIDRLKPSHPSEIMNRVPGVWVNTTGGEGHMAAIRHPMTTNPVYLYLENGVPTRSTGFFNHNALYEVDIPHASRIEVVKGPSTALYGSDAIGGMVNVLTHSPRDAAHPTISAEAGAFGFGRLLASATAGGVLGELNFTRTDGWREGTSYNRQSGTLRWDRIDGHSSLRTMITYSRIDQNTAGTSALPESDFRNNPTRNLTPISYREVHALRASAAYEHAHGATLLSVTPFARWNTMDMLPNWSLTYDPAISETGHASAGALLKVRHDVETMQLRMIGGLDIDYSPGKHREWQVSATRVDGVFTDYTRGDMLYDYDVVFRSLSPYVQFEATPISALRIVAGLRYDYIGYDYDTRLDPLDTGSHRRPADIDVSYSHLSPKLGVVWSRSDAFRIYGSYGHGFRAPSEGQLFRQGRSLNTTDLRPVRADNIEFGIGGLLASRVSWDLAAYHMRKRDDLLSHTRPDGSTETVNAGETLHRGIEAGAMIMLPWHLRADIAYAYAEHRYEDWSANETTDYSGNGMEAAPTSTANASLTWLPARWPRANIAIDMQHVGPFWMDAANTEKYDGHTTFALRGEAPVTGRISLFGRVTNLFDERYAELASFTTARGREFAPGLPRALYIGARVH